MKFAKVLGAILIACCRAAAAATLHTDDFNVFDPLAPTLDWGGGASPTRIESGGVGGTAYLQISTSGFHLATKNDDPRWKGDYASIGATRIEVDLMAPVSSLPLEMRLVLFGPNDEINRWTSRVSQVAPNDGVWRHYVFSLASSDLVPVLTETSHGSLISDIRRVMFRYDEMIDGPDYQGGLVPGEGTLGLDNIQLAGPVIPPTPGDFDGDGDVDGDDLTKPSLGWTGRFGVDLEGADFLAWQRSFGTPAPAAAAVVAVAEPSTLAIAAIAAIPALLSGRRVGGR